MEGIAALIIWVLANAVYVDMRRRGQRGFKRLCAFWFGWPGTLVGMLSVEESSQPAIRHDDRGLRALVEQIRHDREDRLASGESGAEPEGPGWEGAGSEGARSDPGPDPGDGERRE